MRLLLAEDTADLNRVVTVMLEHAGYEVDPVPDGEAASERIMQSGYDAVILDIMMPKKDGMEVLRDMRAAGIHTPVLMLTAKAELDDRVAGLDAGADDYLAKPFAMKELLARVNAMTRRQVSWSGGGPQNLKFADFSIDGETLELASENAVRLSVREFEMIRLFVQNAEQDLDEAVILKRVWENEPGADSATVYLYVNYLRRKLQGISSDARIEGERGKTYRLTARAE